MILEPRPSHGSVLGQYCQYLLANTLSKCLRFGQLFASVASIELSKTPIRTNKTSAIAKRMHPHIFFVSSFLYRHLAALTGHHKTDPFTDIGSMVSDAL